MKKPLYLALAELIGRKHRLSQPGSNATMLRHVEETLEHLCKEHLPSGSGFDAGTELAEDECIQGGLVTKLVFITEFHHMDDHGVYDGWTSHTVKVTPDWCGFHLAVTGRDRNQIKDFISDTFHNCLMLEVEYEQVPQGDTE